MTGGDPMIGHERAVRRVLMLALAVNLVVAALKVTCGRAIGALAIEADGYHSLTDALVSLVGLASLAIALRPPDLRHPYGHRKVEIVAALFVGAALLFLAAEIGGSVIERVQGAPATPTASPGAIVLLLATLLINVALSELQARVGRRHQSVILLTDAQHTRSDCYTTIGVIVASLLTWLGHAELDVVAAIVVAVLVGKAGVDVIRENAGYLLDVALVEPEAVVRVVESIPPVAGVDRVRTRGTPSAVFMDLRLKLPRHLSLEAVGRIVGHASEAIRIEFPSVVDVVIHAEPNEASRQIDRGR